MKLTSPVFEHKGFLPSKYTCDGDNINPPLNIDGAPKEAKSLVLIMDDPDVPKSIRADGLWDHWVVFNIPISVANINEGENPEGIMGVNTNGQKSYGGPCPPDREHRYFFKLYALDTELKLSVGATKAEVVKAMEGHIVEQAELRGRYERN